MTSRRNAAQPGEKRLGETAAQQLSPIIPDDIRAFLGKPPLTFLEDVVAYDDLLACIAHTVTPKDTIEWIWVRDVCDLVWESRRLRVAKVEIVKVALIEAVKELLNDAAKRVRKKLIPEHLLDEGESVVYAWLSGDEGARANLEGLLAARGFNLATIEAQAQLLRLDDLERLDRLIAISDSRRNAVLRDLDRRRDVLAARLRAVTDSIIHEAES